MPKSVKDRTTPSRICKRCTSYMQYYPDPSPPHHQFRYLKCSCGYTVESGEYLPPGPTEQEIADKLKEIEDGILNPKEVLDGKRREPQE